MSEATPPHPAFAGISQNDHAAWILVASYIFILSATLVSVIRVLWRWKMSRNIAIDDWQIIAATVLGWGQTITITISCNHGLGRHQDTLSASDYAQYSKTLYAAQILTIASLTFAKSSLIFTIISLRPHKDILIGSHALQGLIVLWAFASIFALAFQCDLPQPWDSTPGRCVNQFALQAAIGALNIATDVAIVLLPILLMPRVQLTDKKKAYAVQALFGCRLIVPVMTVLYITALPGVYNSRPADQSWDLVKPTIYMQVMLNLSLTTACIPSVKRFLAELQSGAYGAQVTGDFELSLSGSKTYNNYVKHPSKSGAQDSFAHGIGSRLGFGTGSRLASQTRSQNRSHISSANRDDMDMNLEKGIKHSSAPTPGNSAQKFHLPSHGQRKSNDGRPFDVSHLTKTKVERSDSIRGLKDDVIMQTIDYKVEYEDEGRRNSRGHRNHRWRDEVSQSSAGDGNEDKVSMYDAAK